MTVPVISVEATYDSSCVLFIPLSPHKCSLPGTLTGLHQMSVYKGGRGSCYACLFRLKPEDVRKKTQIPSLQPICHVTLNAVIRFGFSIPGIASSSTVSIRKGQMCTQYRACRDQLRRKVC